VTSEHVGSGGDQTHWWIAYAEHSAVDGTERLHKGSGGAAPIGDGLPKGGAAPKPVTVACNHRAE
jgi:hypothetical protein